MRIILISGLERLVCTLITLSDITGTPLKKKKKRKEKEKSNERKLIPGAEKKSQYFFFTALGQTARIKLLPKSGLLLIDLLLRAATASVCFLNTCRTKSNFKCSGDKTYDLMQYEKN